MGTYIIVSYYLLLRGYNKSKMCNMVYMRSGRVNFIVYGLQTDFNDRTGLNANDFNYNWFIINHFRRTRNESLR